MICCTGGLLTWLARKLGTPAPLRGAALSLEDQLLLELDLEFEQLLLSAASRARPFGQAATTSVAEAPGRAEPLGRTHQINMLNRINL